MFQTFPKQQQLTPTHSAKMKTKFYEYDPISAPQSHYDYELSKRQDILQQNFSTTDCDRSSSSRNRSSKYPKNYYSADPGKTSNNQNQRRTFSLTAPSSIVVSRIAYFDELQALNFTDTNSSSNFEKS